MEKIRAADVEIARQRVGTIVLARWVGVVFATFQVFAYATLPYPDGVRAVALGIIAVLAASNVVFEVLRRREMTSGELRRLSLVLLVTDVVAISAFTWVYAFDGVSVIFAILFLLPIEGAVLFGLPGAMWTWGAVAVLYTGRELFGTRYGNPFEFDSLTFRVGLIGIVAFIVGLLVRDLVRQRHETMLALREAERANESRTRLISMLAHDVRAPIAGARSALDTLRVAGDGLDPEQRDRVVAAGQRQADRALFIASDLLDLARVEAGTLSVEPREVELTALVERVGEVLGDRATPRVDAGDLRVWADPTRLEQVVYNLLDNAAKYGADPIEVTAVEVGDEVEFCIRDHGDGVPAEVDLFDAFSGAGEGAVGLGMWIVRVLVDAMDGTIEYRDADPGACFAVRLPRVTADVEEDRPDARTLQPRS